MGSPSAVARGSENQLAFQRDQTPVVLHRKSLVILFVPPLLGGASHVEVEVNAIDGVLRSRSEEKALSIGCQKRTETGGRDRRGAYHMVRLWG
jgi:hypothetical protein